MIKIPLTVVLPTLNKSENIKSLVKKIIKVVNPLEIIIFDDNSTDSTASRAKKLSKIYPQVKIIVNFPSVGLTTFIQLGINHASSRYIAWMDADLSHPPHTLLQMSKRINNCDLVNAAWFSKGRNDLRSEKITRI